MAESYLLRKLRDAPATLQTLLPFHLCADQSAGVVIRELTVGGWRSSIATVKEPEFVLDLSFWEKAHSSRPHDQEGQSKRAAFLAHLACSREIFVTRGLSLNLLGSDVGAQLATGYAKGSPTQLPVRGSTVSLMRIGQMFPS